MVSFVVEFDWDVGDVMGGDVGCDIYFFVLYDVYVDDGIVGCVEEIVVVWIEFGVFEMVY